jgi:hypothetical protein
MRHESEAVPDASRTALRRLRQEAGLGWAELQIGGLSLKGEV